MMSNPLWFKDAVIYQVHVKSFYDSNGDGIGDFRGLIEKIDYFNELGVTAIWLMPFYPSPLRDDGYDISDYYSVNPAYGTLEDFKEFLAEAHSRGIKVITELVINHTSDQNPWFQAARRAPAGSPEREFYVWNDHPGKYKEARIIFKDFEPSNWTWDPVAKAYFWHRFYSHQPDLNFDNPQVHAAIFEVLDFWLEMGVDGLRLDAVPYLYEREGTNCENLPETHEYLQKLRRHIDENYENRMLLAEANQWPEDAAAYFGAGNECHMNFHFPLMPRLFMSIQMEDRFPIIDILDQTPAIPEGCQWATFLRNHDELTLEMVTDEERDYMYRVYAEDPRARINLGIRRRLAPLLGNNRRRIELVNALLFSLPGTPIVYYGDEIGMGDNFYLGDRNGVRTPMQWAPDRNGGFSKANPQQLYLPTIIDPEYHYEAINVENQRRNLSSLFWWTRRLIAERKRLKAFGHGTIEFLHPENAKVLAFIRKHGDDMVFVVANLSRFVQAAEIDLSNYAGMQPVEVFSRSKFPEIRQTPVVISLGPHDFYWFTLRRPAAAIEGAQRVVPEYTQTIDWGRPLSMGTRELLEKELLPAYLQSCRWFPGNTRNLRDLKITEDLAINPEAGNARLLLVRAAFSEGLPETYIVPLQLSHGDVGGRIVAEAPQAIVATFRSDGVEAVLHDAVHDSGFRASLLQAIAQPTGGRLRSRKGRIFDASEVERIAAQSQLLTGDHANYSINYGSGYFLKLYRRLEWGKQPEEELSRYLSESRQIVHVPPFAGALEYFSAGGYSGVLALLVGFVQNQGDGWSYTVDAVGRYFERILAARPLIGDPEALVDAIGAVYPERARQLGQRTAEMHLALASEPDHPAFGVEVFSTLYQRSLYQATRGTLRRTVRRLGQVRPQLPENTRAAADQIIRSESILLERYGGLLRKKITAAKTAVHGCFHLGQVLNTGKDFVITDLEGDPSRALSERQLKRSPLIDVASMMRSFDYAANSALKRQQPADLEILAPWAKAWTNYISGQYLSSYIETATDAAFIPQDREDLQLLLDVFLMDKAVAEINNELAYRPAMVGIPLRALCDLIARAE
ncbi:maltose alpha-D-glucosyltransferase [Verrucomicrobiota bacterium sgz303538]